MPPHELAVDLVDPVVEEARAIRRNRPRQMGVEVLEQERDASKRAFRKAALDLASRSLLEVNDDRIDTRIHGLEPPQRNLEQLAGAHLTASHQLGQAETVEARVLIEGHGAPSAARPRTTPDERRRAPGESDPAELQQPTSRDALAGPLTSSPRHANAIVY